jgi:anti-sigma B factor antagonist
MLFHFNTQNGVSILRIEGELDALSVVELRPIIGQVVDLSRLRLIDSSGVGAIVALFKVVREYGGNLVVDGVRDQPLAILRLLRLDRVLIRDVSR